MGRLPLYWRSAPQSPCVSAPSSGRKASVARVAHRRDLLAPSCMLRAKLLMNISFYNCCTNGELQTCRDRSSLFETCVADAVVDRNLHCLFRGLDSRPRVTNAVLTPDCFAQRLCTTRTCRG